MEARESFTYETTLSSHQSIALMSRCRELGYQIALVYVALANVELNILRVEQRVSRGGHHIPDATIRRRYSSSVARLPAAIRLAHSALLFDNSGGKPVLMVKIAGGHVIDGTLDPAKPMHARVAGAVAEGLNVASETIFQAARGR